MIKKFLNSQLCVSIHNMRQSIRVSIHPTIPLFHKMVEGGGELDQQGDIEKIEKILRIFYKILNFVYQYIP